jgi:hypothetical protein
MAGRTWDLGLGFRNGRNSIAFSLGDTRCGPPILSVTGFIKTNVKLIGYAFAYRLPVYKRVKSQNLFVNRWGLQIGANSKMRS